MFGKKKNEAPPPPRRKGAGLMTQMGLGGMEEFESELYGDVDDDDDLEAELLALQGKPQPPKKAKGRGLVGASDFDQMISASMKDLDDEEVSDTEDPDLLDELEDLKDDDSPTAPTSPVAPKGEGGQMALLLEDRLQNYQQASSSAKAAGDASKQKRMDRGVKTIQDLLKKARMGKPVDEDDIPPPVAITASKPSQPRPEVNQAPPPIFQPTIFQPTISDDKPAVAPRKLAPPPPQPVARQPAPTQPVARQPAPPQPVAKQPASAQPGTSSSSAASGSSERQMLVERRDQYKKAALAAKHGGDSASALKYVKVSKQFDKVLEAVDAGNPIDLSQMPPPPPGFTGSSTHVQSVTKPAAQEREALQRGGEQEVAGPSAAPPAPSEDEERSLFEAPTAPKTVMDALVQRLDKYKNAEQQAKEEGNNSKSRRMGRITKQYQDAIKAVKAGKPVDFDELPTPPGYAPIPVATLSKPTPSPGPSPSHSASTLQPPAGRGQAHPQPGQRSPQLANRSPQPQRQPEPAPAPVAQPRSDMGEKAAMKRGLSMRADQQAQFLKERMQEYKHAAIAAKKNNDIALAKQYLRMAKGFEPMILASESGLPVDLSQLPPQLDSEEDNPSFVLVSAEDCELSGDRTEVFKKLEEDIITQIRTCMTNSSHFSKLGDVISANKFQKMESGLKKDLDALKNAFRHNDPVPKFHYENRTFSIVQCNTDLGDNDCELTIVRGVQYNLPSGYSEKDLDTYIKYEFPFPNDEPQTGHTDTVKGTFNPEYNSPFKLELNRKSRALVRVIERKTVKCEVFYRRGFLKSDKLLGTANVKLVPLETQCTVHDSYDLTDGRKTVGGKLEVKLRIRDPFKSKQVEEVKEKWLVIDQFIKTMAKSTAQPQGGDSKGSSAGSTCMEVLKFEKQQLDKQISNLRDSLSPTQLSALSAKSKLLQEKIDQQLTKIRSGGNTAWKEYVQIVMKDIDAYGEDAKQFAQHGDMQKAQLMLTKKKMAEKEISAIKSKIPNL